MSENFSDGVKAVLGRAEHFIDPSKNTDAPNLNYLTPDCLAHATLLVSGIAEIKAALAVPEELTVQNIVKTWLVAHGYSALCGEECGCSTDDLFACGGDGFAVLECRPGYWRRLTDEERHEAEIPSGSFGASMVKEAPDA